MTFEEFHKEVKKYSYKTGSCTYVFNVHKTFNLENTKRAILIAMDVSVWSSTDPVGSFGITVAYDDIKNPNEVKNFIQIVIKSLDYEKMNHFLEYKGDV